MIIISFDLLKGIKYVLLTRSVKHIINFCTFGTFLKCY